MRWLRCVVLLVGCYNPTVGDGIACGVGDVCPTGQSCVDGVCTKGGSSVDIDASTGSDGASNPDAAIDAMKMIDAPSVTAPQFVGFSFVDAAGTSATVQVPAGVADGDLLLAHVSCDLASPPNINEPSGWTLIIERDGVQNQHYAGVLYRRSAGAASYNWTFPNAYGAVYMMAFRNVDMTTPIDVSDAAVNNDSVVPTAPSVTTTQPQTMLVVMLTQDLSNGPFTPVANMTEVYNQFTDELMMLGAYQPIALPGPTGTRTAAANDIGPTVGFSIALAPL